MSFRGRLAPDTMLSATLFIRARPKLLFHAVTKRIKRQMVFNSSKERQVELFFFNAGLCLIPERKGMTTLSQSSGRFL